MYLDEGTTRTTIRRRSRSRISSWAAIGDYRGNGQRVRRQRLRRYRPRRLAGDRGTRQPVRGGQMSTAVATKLELETISSSEDFTRLADEWDPLVGGAEAKPIPPPRMARRVDAPLRRGDGAHRPPGSAGRPARRGASPPRSTTPRSPSCAVSGRATIGPRRSPPRSRRGHHDGRGAGHPCPSVRRPDRRVRAADGEPPGQGARAFAGGHATRRSADPRPHPRLGCGLSGEDELQEAEPSPPPATPARRARPPGGRRRPRPGRARARARGRIQAARPALGRPSGRLGVRDS